jgi:hypothetical protein
MQYEPQPPKDFKTTMDYKQKSIREAQRSTQESIRVSGSATDATLLTCARMQSDWDNGEKKWSRDEVYNEWKFWREKMFKERDIEETYKNLTEPF